MSQTIDPSLEAQFERLPPSDASAERCAIASAMLDAAIFCELRHVLSPGDFVDRENGVIWQVMCEIHDAGAAMDGAILCAGLRARTILEEVGGRDYILEILQSVPTPAHGEHYARIVKQLSVRRQLIAICNEGVRLGYGASDGENAVDKVLSVQTQLAALVAGGKSNEIVSIGKAAELFYESMEEVGKRDLTPTCFRDLDELVGGIGGGEMVIVAARPSMGKSTLMRQMAARQAVRGIPVGLISLEESRMKLARNMLSAECRIENRKVRTGRLEAKEWSHLGAGVSTMGNWPIFIADKAFSLRSIRAAAATLVAKHNCKVLMIDYLQKIQAYGHSRFEQVTGISLELSAMFKELGVAGVVLAQLSRAVEGREDKRPTMSDLRESGQIEQDADGIIFLHREDYYRVGDMNYDPSRKAELIIAKWRDAERGGVVELKSDMTHQRFDDAEVYP